MNWSSLVGGSVVPVVLLRQGDHHLVDERVARVATPARTARCRSDLPVVLGDQNLAAAGRGPHPDDGVRIGDAGRDGPVRRQLVDRHLQGEGVDVRRHGGVDARHGLQGRKTEGGVRRRQRPQDRRGRRPLRGPRRSLRPAGRRRPDRVPAGAGTMLGRGGQAGVVRGRERADVAGRAGEAASEHGPSRPNRIRVSV